MMNVPMRVTLLLVCLGSSVGLAAEARAERPFDIGVLPGDVVLGNIKHFPGHAGIFIGRWQDLPERLQEEYADVFARVLIRSKDHGLARSYLVVDSIGGGGVRLRSFAEQFTGYLPNQAKTGTIKKALHWEAKTGGAVAWPGLGPDDARRWKIVEESLEAARAEIPYEVLHRQMATTGSFDQRQEWVDGIKVRTREFPSYKAMRKVGLDCISLVHVVYWRGAQIDLDVSWAPWHTPEQLHLEAKKKGYMRAVLFEDVFVDAALLGKWEIRLKVTQMWEETTALPETLTIWLGRSEEGTLTVDMAGEDPSKPRGKARPVPGELSRSRSDTLTFALVNGEQGAPNSSALRFEIGADGAVKGSYEGIDPPDSDGEGGGKFRIDFEGRKLLDRAMPPREQ